MLTRFISDRVITDFPPPFVYSREAVLDFLVSLNKTLGVRVLYYRIHNPVKTHRVSGLLKENLQSLVTSETTLISASCIIKGKPAIVGFDFNKKTVYTTFRTKDKNERKYLTEKLNLYGGPGRYN